MGYWTRGHKWTRNKNRALLERYYASNPSGRGYIKRMRDLWNLQYQGSRLTAKQVVGMYISWDWAWNISFKTNRVVAAEKLQSQLCCDRMWKGEVVLYVGYIQRHFFLVVHQVICFLFQVILTVTLNLAGVAFAITAIVLYSIHLANIYLWWGSQCDNDYNPYWYQMRTTTVVTPSPEEMTIKERCLEGQAVVISLKKANS